VADTLHPSLTPSLLPSRRLIFQENAFLAVRPWYSVDSVAATADPTCPFPHLALSPDLYTLAGGIRCRQMPPTTPCLLLTRCNRRPPAAPLPCQQTEMRGRCGAGCIQIAHSPTP